MEQRKVLLVDDELPALTNMQCVLAHAPGWQVVASCRSADEARAVLGTTRVDLALLDIEMPGQSGLAFARELSAQQDGPLIVFITAYDQHAVSAFDVFALDYLLKPFDDERFAQMLRRAGHTLDQKEQAARQAGLHDYLRDRDAFDAGQPAPPLAQLIVRSVGHTERIAIDDVIWFGAAANYVEVHLATRVVLHRTSISALGERLPPGFMRMHRNAIVRASAITGLKQGADGCMARLFNGDTVRVSESYMKQVRRMFDTA